MTNEEFHAWKHNHPISIEFFKYLKSTLQQMQTEWSSGKYVRADDIHWTGVQNMHAYTKAATIEEILGLEAEDIEYE